MNLSIAARYQGESGRAPRLPHNETRWGISEMTAEQSDEDSLTRIKLAIAKVDHKLKEAKLQRLYERLYEMHKEHEAERDRLEQLLSLVRKLDQDIHKFVESADE